MAVLPGVNKNPIGVMPGTQTGQLPGATLEFPQVLPKDQVSTPMDMLARRTYAVDNFERAQAQRAKDNGIYARPAVGPVEYSEGNIKKSNQPVGVAGYNHRQVPMPLSADDLSQEQYFAAMESTTPERRELFNKALSNLNQFFLNAPDPSMYALPDGHNMVNNLMAIGRLAKAKKEGRA